jgi:hypothetical protein
MQWTIDGDMKTTSTRGGRRFAIKHSKNAVLRAFVLSAWINESRYDREFSTIEDAKEAAEMIEIACSQMANMFSGFAQSKN